MPAKAAKAAKTEKPENPDKADKAAGKKAPVKKTAVKKTLAKADRPLEDPKADTKKELRKTAAQSQEYSLPSGKYHYANGKRKTAVARVRLYKGDGSIFINEKPINKFCTVKTHTELITSPLKLVGMSNNFTVLAKTSGGGVNAQAEAVRHGISKALVSFDETLRPTLRRAGFLTRDPRAKERKKYGLHRARRGPQFSKR